MYTQTTFDAEIRKIWSTITAFRPNWYQKSGLDQDLEIRDAWSMYENAKGSNLSELLLGDLKLRTQLDVLQNFGTTSGTETTMERGTLLDGKISITSGSVRQTVDTKLAPSHRPADGIAHIRRGSVLNDGWWWPFKNDAWVMGGIHGLKRFHLTLAEVPDDLIWDLRAGRPRVLGRELLGLGAFGYSLIGVPSWAVQAPTRTEIKKSPALEKGPVTQTPVSAKSAREFIGNVFAPTKKDKAQAATFTTYYDFLKTATNIDAIKNGILGTEVAYSAYDFATI
jgi:hypothetical protein